MDWLIISLLFIFAGLVIFRPKWGGLLIISFLPAYLLRFSVAGIPTTWLEVAIYLWTLVTFIDFFLKKELKNFLKVFHQKTKAIIWPVGIFFLAAFISVFISPDLLKAAGAFKAWIFDPILFLFLFVYHYRQKDYKKIMFAVSVCTSLVSIWGLVEYFGDFGMQIPGFLNAMYESANMAALLLVPLWLLLFGFLVGKFFQGLEFTQPKRADFINFVKDRFLVYILVVLLLGSLAIYLTRSYAGLLAWLVGLFIFINFIPRIFLKIKRAVYLSFVIIILLVGAGLLQQGKLQRFFDKSTYNSWQTRHQIWHVAASLLQDNYLLGIGFNNFEHSYYQRAFSIYNPPLEWEVPKSHNLYLNTWLEMGFFGLFSLLWLIFAFFLTATSSLRMILEQEKKSWANYFIVLSLLISLSAVLLHGILDTPYFKNDLSVLWWFLFGLLLVVDFDLKSAKS